jgi:putative peptidoglycan lipid II flippase
MSDAQLVRSTGLMAVGTIVSRLTGVIRNTVVIAAIGGFVFADTYSIANTVPNVIYILLVGGALNAVFVPQLVRHMKDDWDAGDAYTQRLLTAVVLVLLVVTALAVVLAPLIIDLYTTDKWTAADVTVSTMFARYCLPQILFYGLFTVLSQVLNVRGHFSAPMFAPIINNVVVTVAAVMFMHTVSGIPSAASVTSRQVALLGIGTTLGVVAQAATLVPFLRGVRFPWRLRFDLRGTGLGHTAALAKWTVVLVLINQIGYLLIARFATSAAVPASATAAQNPGFTVYSNAYLVFLLPQSVITVSLVTALLPRISRLAHAGDLDAVRHNLSAALRLCGVLIIPSAALLFVLGPQVGVLLFSWGASGIGVGRLFGVTASAFALGLPMFSVYYVLLRGFYSLEDTRTPATNAVVLNVINVALAAVAYEVLPPSDKVAGMAAAYSLAYAFAVIALWLRLRRRLGGLSTAEVVRSYVRMSLAAALCGAAAWATAHVVDGLVAPGRVSAALTLAVAGSVGAGIYLAICRLMHLAELADVMSVLRRRPVG